MAPKQNISFTFLNGWKKNRIILCDMRNLHETHISIFITKVLLAQSHAHPFIHCLCLDFPGGSAGKESTCNAGDLGSMPELGRSPGEGKSYPLQYSGLENSMDCTVHGVTKSQTQLTSTSLVAFVLQWQNWIAETVLPTKLKVYTIWPFREKVKWLLS